MSRETIGGPSATVVEVRMAARKRLGHQVRLFFACSLLRSSQRARSTVRGAFRAAAHCSLKARLRRTADQRSRSDKATKSSCCRGKFTIHPLNGKPVNRL
jgi:hypothetical protein